MTDLPATNREAEEERGPEPAWPDAMQWSRGGTAWRAGDSEHCAGTAPAKRVHPEGVAVTREVGIDLSTARPTRLTDELAASAQLLVTMGCGESYPVVPGLRRQDWNLPDPKGQPIERVRTIRDEIRVRVERLITAEGWEHR